MYRDLKKDALSGVKLFVLDMDGTFYLGDQIIDGAMRFVETVTRLNLDFMFFTNNSSRTSEAYLQKLAAMGCRVEKHRIMTSGDVAIGFLRTHYRGASVYLMGTEVLRRSFLQSGIRLTEDEQPDVVVAAFDMELTYHKLERACTYLRNGAVFFATHPISTARSRTISSRTAARSARRSRSRPARSPGFWGNPAPKRLK
jgi:HAD superfamily hydrolase (TIGR01450 family)